MSSPLLRALATLRVWLGMNDPAENHLHASHGWLLPPAADRRAELLPVPYYHVVFTLPAPIADIAYTNKAVIYDALFKAASQTLLTIAADPKHLGAQVGLGVSL